MRIVQIITRSDAIGGASIHVRDLSQRLIRDGHIVTVLVGGNGGNNPVMRELNRAGVTFRVLNHLRRAVSPLHDVLGILEITFALRRLRPDVVATHTAKAGTLGRIAAFIIGVPSIYTPHGWAITGRISRLQGVLFGYIERFSARLCQCIINVSVADRELALRQSIALKEKMVVVHNGIEDVCERAAPGRNPPRVIMVARMDKQKDHATLLRALASLRDHCWELELIGDGPSEVSLKKLASEIGIKDRVHFNGACSDVAERLSQAQIFVLTTNWEGFPISILEAMRAGLPVVATDTNGVNEQVTEGVTGLLVRMRDPSSVSKAIQLLLENPELRVRMGQTGRKMYEQRFTFEEMYSKTLSLYRELDEYQHLLENVTPDIAAQAA